MSDTYQQTHSAFLFLLYRVVADKHVADRQMAAPLGDEAEELLAGLVVRAVSDAVERVLMLDALHR